MAALFTLQTLPLCCWNRYLLGDIATSWGQTFLFEKQYFLWRQILLDVRSLLHCNGVVTNTQLSWTKLCSKNVEHKIKFEGLIWLFHSNSSIIPRIAKILWVIQRKIIELYAEMDVVLTNFKLYYYNMFLSIWKHFPCLFLMSVSTRPDLDFAPNRSEKKMTFLHQF